MSEKPLRNIVIVSDIHAGCKLGLCPGEGIELDEGGMYMPSPQQQKVWERWEWFWDEWVPRACHDEPFALVINGDSIDGMHHNSVTQVTNNLTFQKRAAMSMLRPQAEKAAKYYHIRGTEAHVGQSGAEEESLARELGAIPNAVGQYARYELWLELGPALVHVSHHIGTSGSSAYESTAVMREMTNAFVEAGRWDDRAPNFLVRSHRHRNCEVRIPNALSYATAFVTSGWQLRTPLVFRLSNKMSQPMMGGSVIRWGDEDVYSRHKTWSLDRDKPEQL